MSEPSPAHTQLLPGDWRYVAEELPPRGVIVEARITLSETRSIILNVICEEHGAAASVAWINSTTGGPLREGWRPVEWRYTAAGSPQAPLRAPTPKRA